MRSPWQVAGFQKRRDNLRYADDTSLSELSLVTDKATPYAAAKALSTTINALLSLYKADTIKASAARIKFEKCKVIWKLMDSYFHKYCVWTTSYVESLHQRYESFLTFVDVDSRPRHETSQINWLGRDFLSENGIFKIPSFNGGIFNCPVLTLQS